MAQRFGGKFSPSAQQSTRPDGRPTGNSRMMASARVNPVGLRANLMFVPAAILMLFSLGAGASGLVLGLIGAGLWAAAAVMLREGLKAQAAYEARKVARRPALPRKILAGLLCGLGGAVGAWSSEPGVITAALYGVACLGLHLAAFGIDPLSDKGVEGIDEFQSSRVARVVDEAETHLAAMKDAVLRAKDRQVELRVDQFQAVARDLCRTVEEDPRDLTAARKYLTVYLLGARDATVKFADIFARSGNVEARADYLALLDDLEQNFAARNEKLLLEDRGDLNIEIDVLRARLEREGVQLDRPS
ncbi:MULTISPECIES: 5-bromo-4-chloroindolyl phosphate hydrolysis family protein [Tritonibacter]|uniref:5-bromo-4-chloroindolyl phosphate hydrolysis family protein n=1 Tax=Tritonibacter TaxID=2083206 RepID=UPI0008068CC7|nr:MULTISPECIES: 5-bromo-4-chloroindolyl phosphate hydrolysis family protein [Tritonibacter]